MVLWYHERAKALFLQCKTGARDKWKPYYISPLGTKNPLQRTRYTRIITRNCKIKLRKYYLAKRLQHNQETPGSMLSVTNPNTTTIIYIFLRKYISDEPNQDSLYCIHFVCVSPLSCPNCIFNTLCLWLIIAQTRPGIAATCCRPLCLVLIINNCPPKPQAL